MYEYKGRVTRVIDQKTLIIHVDLGFKIYANIWVNFENFDLGSEIIPVLEELLLGKVVYFVSKKLNTPYDVYVVDIAFDIDRKLYLLSDELKKLLPSEHPDKDEPCIPFHHPV